MRVRMASTGHSLKRKSGRQACLVILGYIPGTPGRHKHTHLCHDLMGGYTIISRSDVGRRKLTIPAAVMRITYRG